MDPVALENWIARNGEGTANLCGRLGIGSTASRPRSWRRSRCTSSRTPRVSGGRRWGCGWRSSTCRPCGEARRARTRREGQHGEPMNFAVCAEMTGMRAPMFAFAFAAALLLSVNACGGGPPSSSTSPTPNGVPATVTVTGSWVGSASDVLRQGRLSLTLRQNDGDVTGSVTGETVTSLPLYTSGTLTGTVSGSTFRFTIRIPLGSVANSPTCSVTHERIHHGHHGHGRDGQRDVRHVHRH